jgi:predicted ATPase
VRRFLAGLAAAQPVVLVIDDLHWAEPLLLDLVEHLVQWGAGCRSSCWWARGPSSAISARRSSTAGRVVADVVTLGGLDAGAAMRLAANVIGAADLPAAVAAKVLATSEGNPLFVGELVRMLVQEGRSPRTASGGSSAPARALEMPPTIHALLAARIERLGPRSARCSSAPRSSAGISRGARWRRCSAGTAASSTPGSSRSGGCELTRAPTTGWLLGEPLQALPSNV